MGVKGIATNRGNSIRYRVSIAFLAWEGYQCLSIFAEQHAICALVCLVATVNDDSSQ
jgi:hypothetical protein